MLPTLDDLPKKETFDCEYNIQNERKYFYRPIFNVTSTGEEYSRIVQCNIFCEVVKEYTTRMHSSRMRTARSLPCRGRSPWQRPPRQRPPPSFKKHGTRQPDRKWHHKETPALP